MAYEGKIVEYYDTIYQNKKYKEEVNLIHNLIKKYKITKENELLDVACGTGGHINYLRKYYNCTGLDRSNSMLKVARNKFPNIKFLKKNMISFDIKKKFDIITCLFSSIGYVKNYKNLNLALNSFSKHLKKGGIVVIEPFHTPPGWHAGRIRALFINEPGLKIARMNLGRTKGELAVIDYHILVATKKGVNYFNEYTELGLFDSEKFVNLMVKNGFDVKIIKSDLMERNILYLGIKK